ncbi:actin-1-like [Gastrophryne carolinensis]
MLPPPPPPAMYKADISSAPVVIFDTGSGLCKAGFSGDQAPKSVIMSLVGRCRSTSKCSMMGITKKNYYIGEEAQTLRGVLSLKYPLEHGVVKNWEDMEKIWKHMYKCELNVKASERPVLLTEAPQNPTQNREIMAEVMFEKFKVPALYVASEPTMALYAYGRISGILLDIGAGVTYAHPTYDGYQITHAEKRQNLGGRDITNYLRNLVRENGLSFMSSSEKEIAREIKEKLCYVALDTKQEALKYEDSVETHQGYKLPDGNTISLGSQCFRAPEAIFSPDLIGLDFPGVHKLLNLSITKCDIDIRKTLFNNVLLAGGSTLFPGFQDRLCSELKALAPSGVPVNIIAPDDRQFSVWLGASVFSSLNSMRDVWIPSSVYEEFGPSVVHQSLI